MLNNQRLHLCVDCCSYGPISLDGPNCHAKNHSRRCVSGSTEGGAGSVTPWVKWSAHEKWTKVPVAMAILSKCSRTWRGPNMYNQHL